ncbi:hypothetical protein V5799_014079 [Amblyomma americanum]|uniref:Transmembrane protein n=1 Tax=Amblyomma americanum TaxID=6943 RepID=A0AAQ4E428_AMBAM
MDENVLQQRPRPVVIVTRKGMYAITAMIAVIGVVCVTALSYSFTDTGKVKISFRPIEEFGFKLKRGRPRRSGLTLPITPRVSRRGFGAPTPAAPPAPEHSSVGMPSEIEDLCGNNTIVGIDADKAVVRGNSLVGSVLNGSIIEIVNGSVFVNGVLLNCSWFLVNVTVDFFSPGMNSSVLTKALLRPVATTVASRNVTSRHSRFSLKGHKRDPKKGVHVTTARQNRTNGASLGATPPATPGANASVSMHDVKVIRRKDSLPVLSAIKKDNRTAVYSAEMPMDAVYRTSAKPSMKD